MEFPRSSGILLHPTSLPGKYGIGDFGPEAFKFADWLAEAKQTVWQMLPLGPTGCGNSPYTLFSAFAGNPLLISLERLAQDGMLTEADLQHAPVFPESHVEFEAVMVWKNRLLRKAYENFSARAADTERNDFEKFREEHGRWLEPYALFLSRKEEEGPEKPWAEWKHDEAAAARLATRIDAHRWMQFCFFRQYEALKRYCHQKGIRLMGDVPIYVALDSADVWQHPDLFELDDRNRPTAVAGVPPDYFSATGQLWGTPLYRWDRMREDGFRWWTERLRVSFAMFDLIRLDHFRGFAARWEVAAGETTAVNGRWVQVPGEEFFDAAHKELGELPCVAENLGMITPDVEALRERCGFPGMKVLQFGFGSGGQAKEFQPHSYTPDCFAYTGTHDNDTTVGWWESTALHNSTRSPEEIAKEKDEALDYFDTEGGPINWVFIEALMKSAASTVVFPLQDVLGEGSDARMNTPGKADGNWGWRFGSGVLSKEYGGRLRGLVEQYHRG